MRMEDRFRGFLPVVVDLETAGTDPTLHALLEIAVVTLSWESNSLSIADSFTWSVVPHVSTSIDLNSLKYHRIDPSDPNRKARGENECIRECFKIVRKCLKDQHCQRALLTGHNAHFDRVFLKAAQNRNKIGSDPFHPFTVVDTASLSILTQGHSVLSVACQRAGIDYDSSQAHDALYDATIAAKLFCAIVNQSDFVDRWNSGINSDN